MNIEQSIHYWIESADDDWVVAQHLIEKGDYSYALFFAHLSLEKILKAIFVYQKKEVPPYTHRLVYLAESLSLDLNPEQMDLLETVTDFNLEARYPDEKFSFKKKCTRGFTERYIEKIQEMKEWLMKKLPS